MTIQLPLELDEVPEPLHDCLSEERYLKRAESPANARDWSGGGSSQSYQIYRCSECGDIWGCRHQYDAGTGHDDRWHRFGFVDPATVKRHY